MATTAKIPELLLRQLQEDLCSRHIERGMSRLEARRSLLASLHPSQENAAVLLGYLAQWVDIGFDRPELVKEILTRFCKPLRAQLKLGDYVHLRMAEGMLAMAEEAFDEAISHFDFVLIVGEEVDDKESLAIADFWRGRCLRKKGEYDRALVCTLKGRDLATALGHTHMAAVMRVLESWLVFQKGRSKEAVQILQEAEAVLRETDDYVTLGNIQSSYGRIGRREGRYHQAIEHFTRAIAEYKRRDPQHRNVARSLGNLAFVKRLIALELRRKLDADVAKLRKTGARSAAKGNSSRIQHRRKFEQLRQEALTHLEEAASIYRLRPNHHGSGTVHLNFGYLYLDNGELDRAEAEAAAALKLGEEKSDFILMARARLLQCMTENAKVDEEIGEGTDPGSHARLALEFAQDAIEWAKHTQNRQLLANAHIWQGLTQCNGFFDNPDAARQSYDLVMTLLKDSRPDYMRDDLETLQVKVNQSGNVNSTLRAWSQGSVGDKTFQQITEEFAELIIPKVWQREGRKVSRVAKRLSISPKKVRRILDKIGRNKSTKRTS